MTDPCMLEICTIVLNLPVSCKDDVSVIANGYQQHFGMCQHSIICYLRERESLPLCKKMTV